MSCMYEYALVPFSLRNTAVSLPAVATRQQVVKSLQGKQNGGAVERARCNAFGSVLQGP
jgi:hypothetical protein